MIRVEQLKLNVNHTEEDFLKKLCKTLRIEQNELISYTIRKQSLDARKKPELFYNYVADVSVRHEQRILAKNKKLKRAAIKEYAYPQPGETKLSHRPVVIGSGPAGIFCAYALAELGYCPILLERGEKIEKRKKDVEVFWSTGVLNPNSNIQFGEGGAGTFSDGKLNTLVKDSEGRGRKVLEIFVEQGAPSEILYLNKPHIGTDILMDVVRNLRKQILKMGGEIYFHNQVTDMEIEDGKLTGLKIKDTKTGESMRLPTEVAVLAIGHSARDTFQMLFDKNIPMEAKSFAVGVRIEHPQSMIDQAQYGRDRGSGLSAAEYKLTANFANGRSVYTFCMCPGGYVVNASSENGMLAVNGMSYHSRAGENANSAVIVTVHPEDFPGEDALAGIKFQRDLEQKAYLAGEGKIPVQTFGDFCKNKKTEAPLDILPQMKGQYQFANVRSIFPEEIAASIESGIHAFDHKLKGYGRPDALLSGVESRTSSPVRILRNELLQSSLAGIYPCGEGAGYAGGITSAAMDGLKVAEAIVKLYQPFDKRSND